MKFTRLLSSEDESFEASLGFPAGYLPLLSFDTAARGLKQGAIEPSPQQKLRRHLQLLSGVIGHLWN